MSIAKQVAQQVDSGCWWWKDDEFAGGDHDMPDEARSTSTLAKSATRGQDYRTRTDRVDRLWT
jgi:hypothetical protein